MNPDKSPQNLFNEALGRQDAGERARFLDEACGADAALRKRVEKLLRAHDEAGGFFSQPSKVPARASGTIALPVTEKPGDRIGRYKLLQQIGEGGMGLVYMAEQEEPVRRRVALKVIKLRLLPGYGFPLCQERRTLIVQGFQKEQLARFESCAPQTGHQPRAAGMHSPPPFVISY